MAIESPINDQDEWFTGEDKLLRFVVYGQDETNVEDVTGWTFTFNLYRRRGSSTPAVTKTSNSGISVLDGPGGVVGVQINADDTRNLSNESWNYVFKRVDPGNEQVLAYGGAVLRQVVGA